MGETDRASRIGAMLLRHGGDATRVRSVAEGWFGSMGLLSDLVLCAADGDERAANARLDALRADMLRNVR